MSWRMKPIVFDRPQQFWRRVEIGAPNECWPCRNQRQRRGYCKVQYKGERYFASRLAWFLANGRQPDGFVMHLCDNPPCCNPSHLTLGTHADNMRDMAEKGRSSGQQKTHCPQGHEYNEANTYHCGTRRHCRACGRAKRQRYVERLRAAA